VQEKARMNPGVNNPNLDKPAGPVDPEISFISIKAVDGRPLALLANYSLHYVGGVEPLSADYYGAFAGSIQQLLGIKKGGPAFVGILSNGTSGNINNINYGAAAPTKQRPYEQCRLVADRVAMAARDAYQKCKHRDDITLAMAEKEIMLGVRHPDAKEIERAKTILASAKGRVLKGVREVYARETVLLAKYPKTVSVKIQAIRIGDLGIVAIPCEVFTEIGLEIKKVSPLKPTFTIELANGYNGYLPTPEQHKLGGYETWRARSAYLEAGASPKIVATVKQLLKAVAESR
jgi:hypothetical protein